MTAKAEVDQCAGADPVSAACGLTVTVLRSMDEVAGIVPTWRELSSELNADPDFFRAVIANRSEVVRPHVLTVERDGNLVTILAARLENTKIRARFGYVNLMTARARRIAAIYGGFLGEHSEAICHVLLEKLRESLATGEAELIYFAPLPLDHPLHTVIRRGFRGLLQSRGEEPILHWELALPKSLDSLLMMRSSKARRNIRSYQKRLETVFADEMEFRILRTADGLDSLLPEMHNLTSKTYKQALGIGFSNTPYWRVILALGFDKGWLRIYLLRIKGTLVSYCVGYIYKRKLLRYNSAYDPEFTKYRIGRYVLLKMFEDLCTDPTVDTYDYGFGDAEYKREFATHHWKEAGVTFYAMTARGTVLWSVVRLTETAARGARWAVRRIGREQRLKTLAKRVVNR